MLMPVVVIATMLIGPVELFTKGAKWRYLLALAFLGAVGEQTDWSQVYTV